MEGPLTGLRIIDSTSNVAMPTAMHIMADMGAEVIKVESHTRIPNRTGSYADNDTGTDPWNRESSFNSLHRSKLGVTINFKAPDAVEAFKDLVRVSDVVAENNRAGIMDRLGLGYEEMRKVKPDLVYFSNTGFGATGPWRLYSGTGSLLEQTCGMSQFTGYLGGDPRRIGGAWVDIHTGWMAVFAILSALHYRNQTGEGQWIDFGMYQMGVSTMGDAVLDWIANGRNGEPRGNQHPFQAPHGVYRCRGKDQWIAIATETDQQWNALVQVMANPSWIQDPKFGDPLSRWHHQVEIDHLLEQWTQGYEHRELMVLLQGAGVPAAAVVNTQEVMTDPHMRARGFYERISHTPESGLGIRAYVGRPWKMSRTPTNIRRSAPKLGEHNQFVLGELIGRTDTAIANLYQLDVLGKEPADWRPPDRLRSLDNQVEQGTLMGYDLDYKKKLGLE